MNTERAPYYIRSLLDIHTLPSPDVSETAIRELFDDGLIEQDHHGGWITTPRGRAYVKLLGEVPLPEQQWIDPRLNLKGVTP